jgi:hypothetical protein
VAIVGCAAVGFTALTAVAADDTAGIDLFVDIEDVGPPGQLTMTVAPNDGVVLVEEGSDEIARQFVGTTPTVTVTDTRSGDEIPPGSWWAVVGQASDFVADGVDPLGAEYLGWTPNLLTGSDTGLVAEGEPVSSVISDGTGAPAVGLVGQEMLVSHFNAEEETGSWDVNAELVLRTPVDVPAGEYQAGLTLSLFDQQ